MMANSKKKVCYVLCYKDPIYTRSNSLINALRTIDNVELLVIKNKRRGFLRYLEVPPKLLLARLRWRPDVFVVGFRAHEIFWAFYPAMIGKKIIFDEFIDHHDWIVSEHNKFGKIGKALVPILDLYMRLVMKLSSYVLTDTPAHAKLCAKNYKVPPEKVKAVPVGTDETLFYPRAPKRSAAKFEVFFYGNMLPLHGFEIILEAIQKLAHKKQIAGMHFTLVGGRGNPNMLEAMKGFIEQNELKAYITHLPWVEYDHLPDYVTSADVCLGGPFGNTPQANRVITGKTYQFLAMGRPTIVGKIKDQPGFIDRQNCILVNQGDAGELKAAILWCYKNRDSLEALGRQARKLFEARFSSVVISRQLTTLIYSGTSE